ncbi:4813_t:CDS:2 [Acaulospora morrowiae]|uniref:4813_t:CDS:1 n=1 Tax=Acaulospora morrowiae TaxID=94023 RepID=A0A9N8V6L4_9GLOM|nr:4813_t:CDS:2 [Acaulospora morrowiae]
MANEIFRNSCSNLRKLVYTIKHDESSFDEITNGRYSSTYTNLQIQYEYKTYPVPQILQSKPLDLEAGIAQ